MLVGNKSCDIAQSGFVVTLLGFSEKRGFRSVLRIHMLGTLPDLLNRNYARIALLMNWSHYITWRPSTLGCNESSLKARYLPIRSSLTFHPGKWETIAKLNSRWRNPICQELERPGSLSSDLHHNNNNNIANKFNWN